MTEDAEQYLRTFLSGLGVAGLSADHTLVVSDPKLEKAFPQRFTMLGPTNVQTEFAQVGLDSGNRRVALGSVE
jgi:hypothetical protein